MFHIRLFLRNHSQVYRWEELSVDVKQLFPSREGPLAWAEFYIADPKHRSYCFELIQNGPLKPRRYRADIVMLQESCQLLTLISYPRTKRHLLESIGLPTTTIESAVFAAKGKKHDQ